MAETGIADIIIPEVFNPYVMEFSATLSDLALSGVIAPDPRMDALASGGGQVIKMPEWNDISDGEESQVLSDKNPLGVKKVTAKQQNAHILQRGEAWAAHDLASDLSGDDPMRAIALRVGKYWMNDQQSSLVSVMNGVFDGPLAATHVHNISIADGDEAVAANKLGADGVIDGLAKLGDNLGAIAAIAMHSVPFYTLLKLKLIEFVTTSIQNETGVEGATLQLPYYLGKRVIVDDGCRRVAGGSSGYVYSTYLFGNGVIARGAAQPKTPTETDRDSLGGYDVLVNRMHYVIHPKGLSFAPAGGGALVGDTPTNAELATAAKWSKSWADKNIHLIEIKSNG